jgi:hypothetical protein
MRDDAAPAPRKTSGPLRQTLGLVRDSFSRFIEIPWLLAVVVGSSVALFLLESTIGSDPGPRELSRLFAPAPLDAYADLGVVNRIWWLLAITLSLRALVVTAVVAGLTRRALSVRGIGRVAALNAASALSIGGFLLFGIVFFGLKSAAAENPTHAAAALVTLALQLALYLFLVSLFAPMVCRAASGLRIKPVLRDGVIWIIAAAACWLWLFGSSRVEAVSASAGDSIGYLFALGMLSLQAVLLGAIAIRSTETAVP